MAAVSLSRVFDDGWMVSGIRFPVEHKDLAIAYAKAQAGILRNSVPIYRTDMLSAAPSHMGFFHPDGHYSHYSMDEEAKGHK